MERSYYLLKITLVVLAIATLAWTGGVGSAHLADAVNNARYSAPARLEAAFWQAVRDTIEHLLQGN